LTGFASNSILLLATTVKAMWTLRDKRGGLKVSSGPPSTRCATTVWNGKHVRASHILTGEAKVRLSVALNRRFVLSPTCSLPLLDPLFKPETHTLRGHSLFRRRSQPSGSFVPALDRPFCAASFFVRSGHSFRNQYTKAQKGET